MTQREKVHLHLPVGLVRENIHYDDRDTGETRTFHAVSLPAGTWIGGHDYGGWEFNPMFVNPSRQGDGWRHIPLLADRAVRLKLRLRDEDGEPLRNSDGSFARDEAEVDAYDLASDLEKAVSR